eukprot:2561121-Pyramimonas_sp.AAC.1
MPRERTPAMAAPRNMGTSSSSYSANATPYTCGTRKASTESSAAPNSRYCIATLSYSHLTSSPRVELVATVTRMAMDCMSTIGTMLQTTIHTR